MAPIQPRASGQHGPGVEQPRAQPASCCHWGGAVAAALVVAGLSTVILPFRSILAFGQGASLDPVAEPSPLDILRRELQASHPRAQRLVIHTTLGRIFLGDGRTTEAAMHYGEALGLAESQAEHIETRLLLALAHRRRGQFGYAREILKAALGFADETDMEGRVVHALADVRAEMGHFEAAIKLYRRAYGLVDQTDADEIALLTADIAEACVGQGQLKESQSWLTTAVRAIQFSRDSPAGADEEVAAKVDQRLGAVQHSLGDVSSAMELYRRALRAQRRLLHACHPELVSTELSKARALRDLGDAASALREVEALEKKLRDGPQEGLQLSRALILKSDILREADRLGDAETAIQEAIHLQATVLQGQDHPESATALSSYGQILHSAGRAEEAREKYQKALEISAETIGEEHLTTAAVHGSLGALHAGLGDDSSAREHFSKCLEIQLETLGKSNPDVAKTLNDLAALLARQGHTSEAADLFEQAREAQAQAEDSVLRPSSRAESW